MNTEINTRKWYKISADGKVLGRLASRAAVILMGKDKADYAPHKDEGPFLIITDSSKVKVTGNKAKVKQYFKASQYPGNSRLISYGKMMENNPNYIIKHAIKGMLPKNKLGDKMMKRLKVYADSEHPHGAQNPIDLEIGNG